MITQVPHQQSRSSQPVNWETGLPPKGKKRALDSSSSSSSSNMGPPEPRQPMNDDPVDNNVRAPNPYKDFRLKHFNRAADEVLSRVYPNPEPTLKKYAYIYKDLSQDAYTAYKQTLTSTAKARRNIERARDQTEIKSIKLPTVTYDKHTPVVTVEQCNTALAEANATYMVAFKAILLQAKEAAFKCITDQTPSLDAILTKLKDDCWSRIVNITVPYDQEKRLNKLTDDYALAPISVEILADCINDFYIRKNNAEATADLKRIKAAERKAAVNAADQKDGEEVLNNSDPNLPTEAMRDLIDALVEKKLKKLNSTKGNKPKGSSKKPKGSTQKKNAPAKPKANAPAPAPAIPAPTPPKPSSNKKKFSCSLCKKKFDTKKAVQTHFKTHDPLQCYTCKATFPTKEATVAHFKAKHKVIKPPAPNAGGNRPSRRRGPPSPQQN